MPANDSAARDADTNTDQFLTFLLGGEEYGIEILDVQEIKSWGPYTRVPRSPEHVLGVINLRGAIVPLVDLRCRFGLPDPSYDAVTAVIIVRSRSMEGGRVVGLVVDQVSEVYRLDEASIQDTDAMASGQRARFIRGFGRMDDKLVILLDLATVVSSCLATDEVSE